MKIIKKCLIVFAIISFCGITNTVFADNNATVGEQEENYHKLFLRDSAVLLKKGEKSVDLSLKYKRNQTNIFFAKEISRELIMETSFKIGLFEKIEAVLNIPFGYAETILRTDTDITNSNTQIGDINLGTKFLIYPETKSIPDIIGAISLNIPTGQNPYDINEVGIGVIGHWGISGGITAIKAADPAIIFAGLSYAYYFDKNFDNINYKPGWSIGYNFGAGLAFNDKLTLSCRFIGNYRDNLQVNSKNIADSSEPMILQAGFTYIVNKNFTIEPSIDFGLNDDAPDTIIGITFGKKF